MEPAFDWLTLDEDEEVLWADTPHPYSLVPAFMVGVPLSLFLIGIPILVSAYLTYQNTNYVVTSAALYKKTGVLSRNVQRIEFDKVQDTSYRQSFFGSQFGYGTVDISTAGGSGVELSFQSVADPQALQTLINSRIRGRDGGPTDDKAAVLDDILTELRAIRQAVEVEPTPAAVDIDLSGDDEQSGQVESGERAESTEPSETTDSDSR